MAKTNQNNNKKKVALALAAASVFAFGAVSFASCDETTTTTSTVKTDNCAIANGNFEYYTDDNDLKLIVAPNSWSKGVGTDENNSSAGSSSRDSGIVNTETGKWDSMTKASSADKKAVVIEYGSDKVPNVEKALKDGENKWSSMTVYDRLAFYEDLQKAIDDYNDKKGGSYTMADFKYYADNVYETDREDMPECANPGTHDGYYVKNGDGTYSLKAKADDATAIEGKENIPEKDVESSVLMIHNYRTDGNGTAQKYTSSTSVSLAANTSAELSVWVKTADLTYNNGKEVDGNRGANVCVTHTVGGKTLDQMRIKNINTKGVEDNNGWVKYTIYVKACSYASSTFTIVLGLGEGSSSLSAGYVAGYAFFDDVELKIISNEAYDHAVKDNLGEYTVPVCYLDSLAGQKIFKTDAEYANEYVYALDLYSDLEPFSLTATNYEVTSKLTDGKLNNVSFPKVEDNTAIYNKNVSISIADDVVEKTSLADLKNVTGNKYLTKVLADDFAEYPFDDTDDMIFMLSAHGAAYTTTVKAKEGNDLFTLDPDEYMLVSFWVKTSDTTGYTGATATIYDATNKSAIGPYNTTILSTIDLDEQKDIYNGWAQCFFFVQNETEETHDFYLTFSYGVTDLTGVTKTSFSEGYAAIANFSACSLTKAEFSSYAGSAPQSTSVSLTGAETKSSSKGFAATTATDEKTIETNLANPTGYTGVNGGDRKVVSDGTTGVTNQYGETKTAGLLNKNYYEAYVDGAKNATDASYDWLKPVLGASDLSTLDAAAAVAQLNAIFGTATQPLLISNVVEQSYGYLSGSYNLSSNGYSAISLRVMVSAGAKAYIYLVNTADVWDRDNYHKTISQNTVNVTYWYDDDGNVCTADPTDDEFDARSQTAFYKTENGLYKNNANANDNTYYANLANYEKDPVTGNLLVKKDANGKPIYGYNYNEDYVDDGIAFYYQNGKYYAYADHTTEVKDFSACATYVEGNKNFTTKYARYINNAYLETLDVTAADLGEGVLLTGLTDTSTYVVVDGGSKAQPSSVAGKWVTVRFLLHTGNDAFSYRLEAFSGNREGTIKSAEGSYVAFDGCNSSDLASNYDGLLQAAIDDLTKGNDLEVNEDTGRLVYTADGRQYEKAEYFCYSFYDDAAYQRFDKTLDEIGDGDLYTAYAASDYAEGLTYLYHEKDYGNRAEYSMFLDYSPLYQKVTADSSVAADEEEEEEENWWENSDFWLMLSSIIMSAILALVLVFVFVTRIIRNASKGHGRTAEASRYSAKRQRYIRKLNLQTEEDETPAEAPKAEDDANSPYEE